MSTTHHLAQINIARARYEIDAPEMEGFTGRIDAVNALADRSPGFVWRLQGDDGSALGIDWADDPYVLVNMSVWESIDTFWAFVYKTAHAKVMRQREDWFKALESNHMAMWWVPAGHIPTLQEARDKLKRLDEMGPTPEAFTFKQMFAADGAPVQLDFPKKDCA